MEFPFINPVEILQKRAQETPDRLSHLLIGATEAENQSLTYKQLDAAVREMAGYLQSVAEPGQRALLVFPTSLDFIISMYACLYAGLIPIPTNPPGMNRSAQRLETIARDSKATMVLTNPEFHAIFQSVADQFPDFAVLKWITREMAAGNHSLQMAEITPKSTAFIQYTSGSTNIPKGVVISYRNLSYNAHAIRQTRALELTDESVALNWAPLYHDMGLLVSVFQAVIDGSKSLMMSPIMFMQNPASWLRNIQKYKVTGSGAPNFAYELCIKKIPPEKCEGLDLSTWKLAYNSAEPVRAETQSAFAEKFAPYGFRPEAFAPCYGLAEATLEVSAYTGEPKTITLAISRNDFEEGRVTPVETKGDKDTVTMVSSGKPLADIQIAIVDPQTRKKRAANEVGEVWISGGNIAEGYWNRPDDTKHTFQAHPLGTHEGPYLRTGDLGFLHEGHLYITGRLKDLLIVRGRNYYPQDIEATVQGINRILRPGSGAAFSVTENDVEQLVVVQEIQRTEVEGMDINELIQEIRATVAREHGIRAHAVVLIRRATISKTSSGKIMRSETRRQYMENELEVVAEWRAPS
jgi:acyl-CoA synthetase (AMP-forming)/AMP-acid ligase II